MQKLYDYIDEGAFLEDVEAYAEELIQRGEISREQFNREKEKLYTYFDKKCKEAKRTVWEREGKEHGWTNSSRKLIKSKHSQEEIDFVVDQEMDDWLERHPDSTDIEYSKARRDIENYVRRMVGSSRQIKSSVEDPFIVSPWSDNVTGTSDEDLGLSYVVEAYGNEFVNVDDETLNAIKDEILVRYFDDDAYVRDWNINNPNDQIESAYDIIDPETELSLEELARYFDYDAYGRDLRLESNMVWDSENEYWISSHDLDDDELDNDKYIFMGNNY